MSTEIILAIIITFIATYSSRFFGVLTSDKRPLPDKVANYLLDQAEDYGDTKLKNMFPKSKTIKIGKK